MFEKITKTLSGLAFIKYINSLIDYVNTSDIDATRIKGQLDISNIPPAGLDNVIKVDTVTDMLALTVDDVQNGNTVMIIGVTPPVQYQVVDDTKLGTMDAFQEYAAGTATKALADINGNNIHTTYGKLAGNNTWTGSNTYNSNIVVKANGTAEVVEGSVYLGRSSKTNQARITGDATGNLYLTNSEDGHTYINNGSNSVAYFGNATIRFYKRTYIANGSSAGSSATLYLGVKPTNETVQAKIGTDNLGGLFYNTSTNQPHVFRVGNNLDSFVIRDDGIKTAFSNNNHIFASVVDASGNANWRGNANTATKLATARTINGVPFDGTQNITIEVGQGEFLPLTGGTVTGPIYLPSTAPTTDTQVVTKKYVDDSVASAGGVSNLTTYTSLEQLGITPGQETFASIHSALPTNSALEYYVSEAQNFADIYPASYGNFIATRLTGDITIFHFTGTNQIIYVTHYHVTNNTNPSWTQIAKQSDLTNLSNSVVKSVNGIKPTNGNVPNIARTDVANNFVTGQKFLKHPTVSGVGGQLFLEKPEVSTLAGDVVIDVMGEMLRFREKGGSGRGFNMNIASGAANCQSPIVTSVNGVKADYTGNIQLKNSNATPVGTILALLNDEVPEGYLPAEGAVISRTTYADLFNVIGTKFGVGDGSTTFNLPNLVGRFLEGDGVPGTLKGPGLPDHNHSILINLDTSDGNGYRKYLPRNTEGSKVAVPSTQASQSNPIYGASNTVQPKSVTVKFCIKY